MNLKEQYADYTREIRKKQNVILQKEIKIHKLKADAASNVVEIARLISELATLKSTF